jgi:hypothetical protein
MKKTLIVVILALFAMQLLVGCAYMGTGPATLYWDVKTPLAASTTKLDAGSFTKVGTASCSNILGLVATGDCSIDAAMKAGGITKVHHVDFHNNSILGIFATSTVTVYGE